MAIGDSYGAAFEFVEKPYPKGLVNDGVTHQKHPELSIGGGRYTDDTQMAIAIVEEILANGDFSEISLANRFVDVFKRDPRQGYGSKFYALLQESISGADLLANIDPTSTRSGGCMRVGPVGLLPDLSQVLSLARKQAAVTHNTPEAIMAAQAIAASTHFIVRSNRPLSELGDWLEECVPGHAWSMDWSEWASVQAIPVAHAAITALRRGSTMKEVLEIAVDQGGDVDTTAALALWMASLSKEHQNDLGSLYEGLEKGPYGIDYLRELDTRLIIELGL